MREIKIDLIIIGKQGCLVLCDRAVLKVTDFRKHAFGSLFFDAEVKVIPPRNYGKSVLKTVVHVPVKLDI